jgi:hypothetical protein
VDLVIDEALPSQFRTQLFIDHDNTSIAATMNASAWGAQSALP